MGQHAKPSDGAITIAELREFASFPAATQRYIRRSLDVAFHRGDAMSIWGRDVVEEASIRAQSRIYGRLDEIKALVPDDSGLDQVEPFIAPAGHGLRLRSRPEPAQQLLGLSLPL